MGIFAGPHGALAALALFTLVGCGGEVIIIDGSTGGSTGNGSGPTTSGSSSPQGPTSGAGPTTTGPAGPGPTTGVGPATTGGFTTSGTGVGCDAHPPGNSQSPQCEQCVACAQEDGFCATQIDDLFQLPGCNEWFDCVYPGCPADNPNTAIDEFAQCAAFCDMQNPGCTQLYLDVVDCLGCQVCATSCNGDFGLGDCSTLPEP